MFLFFSFVLFFLFLFLFFLCMLCSVCFVAYALLCLFLPCVFLLRLFPSGLLTHSGFFFLRVLFWCFLLACFFPYVFSGVFCTGCFVLCVLYRMVLFQSGHPPPPSPPAVPMERCRPTPLSSCTCTTSSVGQPQGRLKWVKVADGSQISVGGYGSTTLQMTPQTLTLSDHGLQQVPL